MSKFLKLLLILFLCVHLGLKSQTTTTYSILSTAYDRASGVFLPLGSTNTDWVLTEIQDLVVPLNPASVVLYPNTATFVVPNVGNNYYAGIISNHSINNNSTTASLGLKLITFRTYFTLPNLSATTNRYSLSFKMSADDAVDNVQLNGVQRAKFLDASYNNIPGISKPYLLNIPVCDTGFVSGQNYIDVTIADAGGSVGFYGEIELFETTNVGLTLNINASPNLMCAGQTTTLTASGASSYTWTGSPANTATISVTPAVTTTYFVYASNSTCLASDSITIQVDSIPTTVISGNQTICAGQTATLTASGANSYTWSGGSNATTSVITVSPPITTIYTVSPGNGNCTGNPVAFTVTVNSPPIISITPTSTTICAGQALTLTASGSSNYLWNVNNTITNTLVVSPNNTSTYVVQGGIGNCIGSDSVTISVVNPITLTLPNYTVCAGQSVNIMPVIIGGASPYVYNWGGGYNLATYTTIPVADSLYEVAVTDANGCTASATNGIIHVLPPLAINAPGINTCTADTVSLLATATGGTDNYTYTWTPSNSHQNPLKLLPQSSTIYTVVVSDGCTVNNASDTAKVTIQSISAVNIPNATSGCKPVCINLTNISYANLANWQWNFGDGSILTNQKPYYCYNKSGTYNIIFTYTTTSGCVKTVTSNNVVTVLASPVAAFSASTFTTDIFNTEINFYNESTGNISSQWFFGDLTSSVIQNPSHVYSSVGNYPVELIVKNQNGCVDTVMHEVIINDVYTFYAPNTFTPNQDNFNEVFLPVGTGWDNNSFKMLVFDRWGNLILTTANPNQGWDGKVKGQQAQEDTYVWKVELKDIYRKNHAYSGIISIIR